jgi:S1-C subfamily serine protease
VIRPKGQEVTEEGLAAFREVGSGVLVSADGKIATAAHVVHTMSDQKRVERRRRPRSPRMA